MRLPNADHAVIDEAKVRGYLLSSEHPVGRFKAVFFRGLGFRPEDWQLLGAALVTHALSGEATPEPPSVYGQKFRVRAMLQGPSGRSELLLSVWIIRPGEDVPRLVTAFPGLSR